MSRSAVLPWVLLAIWTAWLAALQGLLREIPWLTPWVPDAVLVLLLSLSSRLERHDLPKLALVVGLSRLAVGVEPAAAVLAGTLGLVLFVRVLRAVVEVGDVVARTGLTFVCALGLVRWQTLVMETRALAGAEAYASSLGESWQASLGTLGPHAWTRAVATALCALAAGPALAHLPGLTPLRRRRTWQGAASARSW